MPVKPSRSIRWASSSVALRRPGTATRLTAGFSAMRAPSRCCERVYFPLMRLKDKVIVVTGASRGIGADIARLFAAEGGRIVCAARTLREGEHIFAGALETTVAEIRAAGGEAHAVAANIAEQAECEKLI